MIILATVFAACSQADDALQAGVAVAQGGEPLNIRIAPKPGYTTKSDTRATVNDDTGAFAWEESDGVSVRIIFNDAANTTLCHSWRYMPVNNSGFSYYIPGWSTTDDWQGGRPIPKLVWPLGAGSVTVNAFYGDMSTSNVVVGKGPDFVYVPGETGDYMLFSKTLTPGEDLTVDFVHGTTRLVFTGLAPNTAYSLKAAGTELTFPKSLSDDLSAVDVMEAQAFTSDAAGNLTVCADLDEKIDANGKLTLELVTGGATVYQTVLSAQGTAGAYKMDGYIYKIKVSESGKVNPENNPDLMVPAPIIPGNTVWELNGYYITAPDADERYYQWSADPAATVMDNDPCAGHGNWRMPSMKDFEKMAGWTETNPWSQEAGQGAGQISNEDVWYTIFREGGNEYLSTDVYAKDETQVWRMLCGGIGSGGSFYYWYGKTENGSIRCVQTK